jgi:hypothetical protein
MAGKWFVRNPPFIQGAALLNPCNVSSEIILLQIITEEYSLLEYYAVWLV